MKVILIGRNLEKNHMTNALSLCPNEAHRRTVDSMARPYYNPISIPPLFSPDESYLYPEYSKSSLCSILAYSDQALCRIQRAEGLSACSTDNVTF
jgi:hypothetical protein